MRRVGAPNRRVAVRSRHQDVSQRQVDALKKSKMPDSKRYADMLPTTVLDAPGTTGRPAPAPQSVGHVSLEDPTSEFAPPAYSAPPATAGSS